MTFTEAAIEVLRREGKPLHFKKLAEIAVRESLLDHVGKVPDETMAGQLAAHCRLPHADRKVMPVQPGTFALVEWGLDEDPAGLEGLIEPRPRTSSPYRGRERHPVPSRELARSAGRGEGRAAPPRGGGAARRGASRRPAEVAYEILAGRRAAALGSPTSLRRAPSGCSCRTRSCATPARCGAALAEDNRRRESAGRKPLFAARRRAR